MLAEKVAYNTVCQWILLDVGMRQAEQKEQKKLYRFYNQNSIC